MKRKHHVLVFVGSIYYINQNGACTEVLNTEGVPLSYILYHPTRDIVIVMMEGLTVGHFTVDLQGHLTEVSKVKLNGRVQSLRSSNGQGLVWAGNNCLAILTGMLHISYMEGINALCTVRELSMWTLY